MKRTYHLKTILTATVLIILGCGLWSCKKNIDAALPEDKAAAGINFYSASAVMDAAYGPENQTTAVYLDQVTAQQVPLIGSTASKYPYLSFGYLDPVQYPQGTAGNTNINYVHYNAGNHRVYFTDINNRAVADTTINFAAGCEYAIYLADVAVSPGDAAVYKIISAVEPRKVPEGKTGIRFVHLSSDAGALNIAQLKTDGNTLPVALGAIGFTQVSDYQYFDQKEVSNGQLRFKLENAAKGISLVAGAPAKPGKSYVVIITGFKGEQQRRVVTGKNPDGSSKTNIVSIGNNLKTEIRTSY